MTNTIPATADSAPQVVDAKNLQNQQPASGVLKRRFISGVVMVGGALLITYLGGWPFAMLVAIAASLMLFEWNAICAGRGRGLALWFQSFVIWTALLLVALQKTELACLLLACGSLMALALGFGKRRQGGGPLWMPLGLIYIGVPCIGLLWLRLHGEAGLALTLWVFVIVWATDIGGYFAGKGIGGPKLAPRISPNKTWAGLLGGMVLAVVASVWLGRSMGRDMGLGDSTLNLALLAAGFAVWAQIGDITESAFKRRFGVKDSGALIPGHGGLLDRLDGLLFVAPVVAIGIWWLGNSAI